jgi:hypothetical protein
LPRPSGSQLKLVNLQIKATDLALRFVSLIQIHNLECLGPTRRQLTYCEPVKAIAMQTSVNKLPLLDPTVSRGKNSWVCFWSCGDVVARGSWLDCLEVSSVLGPLQGGNTPLRSQSCPPKFLDFELALLFYSRYRALQLLRPAFSPAKHKDECTLLSFCSSCSHSMMLHPALS